jgi:hypothetical protein
LTKTLQSDIILLSLLLFLTDMSDNDSRIFKKKGVRVNRFMRPTVIVSLVMVAMVVLTGCTSSGPEALASVSPLPAPVSSQKASPTPSPSRDQIIKQVLETYEQPAEEVVFTGVTMIEGGISYNFQLGETAYEAYLDRVGRNGGYMADSYVTTFEESPWLRSPQTDAMPTQGMPGPVTCRISALPWVPAAGSHVPPVTRT